MHKLSLKGYCIALFCMVMSLCSLSCFAQSSLQQFDDRVLINLQDHRIPEATGFFTLLSKTNPYGAIGIPVGLLAGGIISNDKGMRENSLYVASSTALSFALTTIVKHLVKRPRPFIQNIHIVPVYRPDGYSFPSGHTSSGFAAATAVSMAYPKWYVIAPALLWAGAVSYSRMYLGVHYPTDIAGGAVLGAGSAASMLFLKK
jgi:undecaprenyl-diphosphatase